MPPKDFLKQHTTIMAAVEATVKALEQVSVSKTKELKGASTHNFHPVIIFTNNPQFRQRKETLS